MHKNIYVSTAMGLLNAFKRPNPDHFTLAGKEYPRVRLMFDPLVAFQIQAATNGDILGDMVEAP